MYGELKVKDPKGEDRTVPMLANAATPIRFKMLFHVDLQSGIIGAEGGFDIDVVSKLAFVMAKQAAKVDMSKLNEQQYVDWLEDFDSMAFVTAAQDIISIYTGSKDGNSKAKK